LKIPTDLIWVSGDLLLKGAALDVVQIAEELLK
jgi:aspartate-semialdehyde dehydrogenase